MGVARTWCPPILVHSGATNDGPNDVSVPQRGIETLENDNGRPLAAGIPVGAGVKGLASGVRAEKMQGAESHRELGHEHDV